MKMNKSIKVQRLSFFILKKNDILRNNNFEELDECEKELEYWCKACINILRKIKNTKEFFETELKEIENEFKRRKY